jgi:hypothetical protein
MENDAFPLLLPVHDMFPPLVEVPVVPHVPTIPTIPIVPIVPIIHNNYDILLKQEEEITIKEKEADNPDNDHTEAPEQPDNF